MQLSIIDNLYIAKEKELRLLAGNLQPHDLKTDQDFQETVKAVKNRILLNPVIFEQPKIVDHYQETKQMPSSYQNPWGGPREVFVIPPQ